MEENKIIADFMGLKLGSPYMWRPGSFSPLIIEHLAYHKSWDWLMKVVEKIEKEFCSTNIHYYYQKKMYSVEFLGFNIEYDNSEYGDDKMKILYDSCVKFINFYNKRKEE